MVVVITGAHGRFASRGSERSPEVWMNEHLVSTVAGALPIGLAGLVARRLAAG